MDDDAEHAFEAVVVTDREAEQFNTAVFRFLELHTRIDDGRGAVIRSFPEAGFRRQTVALWSAEAVHDFGVFWRGLRAAARSPTRPHARARGAAPEAFEPA
jgi:hypothetical protein